MKTKYCISTISDIKGGGQVTFHVVSRCVCVEGGGGGGESLDLNFVRREGGSSKKFG